MEKRKANIIYSKAGGNAGKGTYEITKIYWGPDYTDGGTMKLFVDVEIHPEEGYDLFQQDPSEWTGSRKDYRS